MGGIELRVLVPELGDNRLTWEECDVLPRPLAVERVSECGDVAAVLRAQGLLVARLLSDSPRRYEGFRVVARCARSESLVGHGEWYASGETGRYLPYPGGVWSACDWGEHGHHQELPGDASPAVS